MNEMVQENVEAALKLSEEVCVYYSPLSNEEPLIAGTMPSTLESTYQLALKLNVITARELIEEVEQYQMQAQNKEHKTGPHEKLNIGASSNRLTRLKEMGLLVPIRVDSLAVGGRQNVYEPVR